MTQKNAPQTPLDTKTHVDRNAPNGVPKDAESAEAKGTPTADRQKTETASKAK